MSVKRQISLLLAVLMVCSVLAGCTGQPTADSISIYPIQGEKLAAPTYGKHDPSVEAVANGANVFAFHLSAELLAGKETENFVCSPYSVWLPLAALVNATDDDSRDALLAALAAQGVTTEDINHAASRMLFDLTKEGSREYEPDSHNPLRMANAIFVDYEETLKSEFAQSFADFYRGQVFAVNFGNADAVNAVNQWASEHTEGLINDIIQQFDPDTVAAIANAIYFSDRWEWEFKADQTTENAFNGPTGQSSAHFMLREGDNQTYYEDDRLQAMPLRFKSGGALYILLPKDGDAAGLLSSIDETYFQEIQDDSIQASGKLLLPRFTIDSGVVELNDALESLGIPLFDQKAAALTGGLIEGNSPVWLSSAVQSAVIAVDEKGTTAAAVTVMAEAGAAMPEPTTPFDMTCDRPFVFILCDSTYDGGTQILFTGIVNQPEIAG